MKPVLALLTLAALASTAAADPRDDILSQWEASRKRVKTVRYTVAGASEAKGDASGGGKNPTPIPAGESPRLRATWLFDLERKRHRVEETSPVISRTDKTKFATRSRVNAFGGEYSKGALPRDKNEFSPHHIDLHISSGDMRSDQFATGYYPLFLAHGFIPSSRDLPSPGRWPAPTDREEFEVHGKGTLFGRSHTILRGEPWKGYREEYWADPSRGGAVGRFVIWVDITDPYQKYDIEYQEVAGVWVVKRWTHTVSRKNRVLQLDRIEVERVDINPAVADADFDIPVEPGFVVKEHVYPPKGSGLNPAFPANKTTRVKADGEREVIRETGFQTMDAQPVPLAPPWWGRGWVWAIVGTATAAVLGWVVWRKARRRTTPEPRAEGLHP